MKNLKMLYIALIALMAGVLGSCTNDPYTAGEQATGPQVYWNSTNPTTIEFAENDSKTKSLTLSRATAGDELEVAIVMDYAEGADASIFAEEPTTVTFEKGKTTAELTFDVNYESFESDKNYTAVFKIYPENITTPYGYSEWTVNFALNPYELMTDAHGNNAKGKFRGASVLDFAFTINPEVEVDVDVYKHKSKERVYKVIDPWPATIAFGWDYSSIDEALADGISTTNAHLVIDASNPEAVIIEWQSMGLDFGYGDMEICTCYPKYVEDPALGAGTLVDGVITFAPKTMFFYSPGVNAALGQPENAILYTNTTGLFRLILPGYEVADYSLAVAYDGMDVSADSKVISAKLQFSYGEDVTGIKYIVVPGNIEKNYAEAVQAIIDGTAENIQEIADFVKGGKSANIKYGLTEQGDYTVVAVPADKSEALRAKEATATAFYFQGLGPAEEHPCEISVDLNKLSEYLPEYAASYPDTHNVSFKIVGKEIKEGKYLMAETGEIEYYVGLGATLQDLVVANGYDFEAADIEEINGENGYINGFLQLDPATSYTMIVWAKNKYGEEITVSDVHTTDAEPEVDYNGELVIGDYYMSCTMGAGTDSETTFENLFTVTPDGESVTDFIVSNIGANVNGINPQWMAKYDSAAGTLTLNGVEKGYEEYGNGFGAPYAYVDAAKTQALVFFSYATADSQSGADPLVLNVDPETKAVCGMQNAAFIAAVVDLASGQPLGYWGYYMGEITSIVPYTPAETASVKKASANVPFSSVNLSRVHSKSIKPVKMANFANTSKKSGVKTVAPTFVENYTPEKKSVDFKSLKEVNAMAFRR